MELSNRQKNQAIYLRELVQSAGWKVYEEFIKDYVFEYLSSSLNKDTLNGLKLAIEEPKRLVTIYESTKNR